MDADPSGVSEINANISFHGQPYARSITSFTSENSIGVTELFSKYVGELYKQANKDEGEFVLSENNKEIDIAKYSEIVINPLSVEINNRKILNKLYEELHKLSSNEVLYMKTL